MSFLAELSAPRASATDAASKRSSAVAALEKKRAAAAAAERARSAEREAAVRAYLKTILAENVENWVPVLGELTATTIVVQLSRVEAGALRTANMKTLRGERMRLLPPALAGLHGRVAAAIAELGGVAFVKMSSRAPKDNVLKDVAAAFAKSDDGGDAGISERRRSEKRLSRLLSLVTTALRADSADACFRLLLGSERVEEDLELAFTAEDLKLKDKKQRAQARELQAAIRALVAKKAKSKATRETKEAMAKEMAVLQARLARLPATAIAESAKAGSEDDGRFPMQLIVRKWEDKMDPRFEFRCFVREAELVAATQYTTNFGEPRIFRNRDAVRNLIETFFERELKPLVPRLQSTSFIVDLLVLPPPESFVSVIELNPFESGTGACLFSWDTADGRAALHGTRSTDESEAGWDDEREERGGAAPGCGGGGGSDSKAGAVPPRPPPARVARYRRGRFEFRIIARPLEVSEMRAATSKALWERFVAAG